MALFTAILCQSVHAAGPTMLTKVKAPELAGTILIERGDDPAPGATVQVCKKGWKDCTTSVLTDSQGKFKFERTEPKHVNYLLITWFGANSVEAEVKIDKKAKPLVIDLHLE